MALSQWDFTSKEELVNTPTPLVDRYFTRRYKKDVKKKKGEDQCILVHSNKLCIVTIAKYHPIMREHKTVTKVNFQVDARTNRLKNRTSGKSKRGAQYLKEGSPLCHVTCSDDSTYTLYAVVRGSLVEANENLLNHPELLTEKPDTDGYIAIMLTGLNDHKAQVESLLSEEDYEALLKKRALEAENSNSQEESSKVTKEEADSPPKKSSPNDVTKEQNGTEDTCMCGVEEGSQSAGGSSDHVSKEKTCSEERDSVLEALPVGGDLNDVPAIKKPRLEEETEQSVDLR